MHANGFPILYQDEHLVAINKPSGWLVHRTGISEDRHFILQTLRNQLKQRLYPLHRLDRGTSGALLFGKDQASAGVLGAQFREKAVIKKYLAIVRGYVEAEGLIDYPIGDENNQWPQDALTAYRRLDQTELPIAIGRYQTARYSLVEVQPATGRWHQIRKHFSHLRHPVIGDKKHGDIKHNAYFRERWGIARLLLHATELTFAHPITQESMTISAPLAEEFGFILKELNLIVE